VVHRRVHQDLEPSANTSNTSLSGGGIAAIFFFYLWKAFYTSTWNGTPWVINSEMFDQNTRSLGQANAAANNWLWNFLISRFTPQMFDAWGYGVYFFFSSLMVLAIGFVWFCIPETKGVPLESMDRLFAIKPVRRAHAVVMAELADAREEREGLGIDKGSEEVEREKGVETVEKAV